MIKTHFKFGCQVAHSFHAEVPLLIRPKVKLVGDMYLGEDGKEYVPELFDKVFGTIKQICKPKFKKGRFVKGELIGKNWVG